MSVEDDRSALSAGPVNPRHWRAWIPKWMRISTLVVSSSSIAYVTARHHDVLLFVVAIFLAGIVIGIFGGLMVGSATAVKWVHRILSLYVWGLAKASGMDPPPRISDVEKRLLDVIEERTSPIMMLSYIAEGEVTIDGVLWSARIYETRQVSIWKKIDVEEIPVSVATWSSGTIIGARNPVPPRVLLELGDRLRYDLENPPPEEPPAAAPAPPTSPPAQ